MALSDLILSPNKVIVTKSTSTLSLAPVSKALNFGIVQYVNQLTNNTIVGQSVWFDVNKSIEFMYISGITYYMVDEDNIISAETALS